MSLSVNITTDLSDIYATVKMWAIEFQCSRQGIQDGARSRRLSTSITQENIETMHQIVLNNRRIRVCLLEETTGISYGSIQRILSIRSFAYVKGLCKMRAQNAHN